MTQEMLSLAVGTIIGIALDLVPGLAPWYQGQSSANKATIIGLVTIAAGIGAYLLSCSGDFVYFECSRPGFWKAVELIIMNLAASQTTHLVTRNWAKYR